jgi:hypothetical protein
MRHTNVPTKEALHNLLSIGEDIEEIIHFALKNRCPPDELDERVDCLYQLFIRLLVITDNESAVDWLTRQIWNNDLS